MCHDTEQEHISRVFFLQICFALPQEALHAIWRFFFFPGHHIHSALQNGVVSWLQILPPFFSLLNDHKTNATEPQHPTCWRTPVTMPTALLSFTHPLRSPHCPDALMLQGDMQLLYQHCSILLYLVSKSYHFGDQPCPVKYWFFCCSNWSSDFSFPNISL